MSRHHNVFERNEDTVAATPEEFVRPASLSLTTSALIQAQDIESHPAEGGGNSPKEELAIATAYASVLTARIHEEAHEQEDVRGVGASALPEGATRNEGPGYPDVFETAATPQERWYMAGYLPENKVPERSSPLTAKAPKRLSGQVAEPVERQRPARPLSFHELASAKERTDSADNPPDRTEITPSASPESAGGRGATFSISAEEASETFEDLPIHLKTHSPRKQLSAFSRSERTTGLAPDLSHGHAGRRDDGKTSSPPTTLSHASHDSRRWDPIPPLRPTDSGWHRVASNSESPQPSSAVDDWIWLSRETESFNEQELDLLNFEPQSVADLGSIHDTDEHALSRPWALLSKFQQMKNISPERKPVASHPAEDSGETAVLGVSRSTRNG